MRNFFGRLPRVGGGPDALGVCSPWANAFAGMTVFLFLSPVFLSAAQTGQSGVAYQYYLKALLLENQGNFAGARTEVEHAIELAPNSAYLHRTAAELSLRIGEINVAATQIERAVELDPKDVRALILSGQILWSVGEAEKAETRLRKALSLNPDESEAVVSLASALSQKKPEEAIKLYKEFLSRHPNEVEIQERLAQLYHSSGKFVKAKETWEDVLKTSPGSVRAHLALAQIAEVNFDTATAISHYEGVLSQDPTNMALLLRVGELRYRNNELAAATDAFTKAQAVSPSSPGANFWLAMLAERRGDWKEAIRLLKNVPAGGRDTGVQLRLAYYYSQDGQYKNAIESLRMLSDSDPANTDFLNYLAVAYEQDKQIEQAEKTLKKIIDIDPNDPEAHFHLATLYDRTKRFPKAEQELRTAISLKPDFHMAMNYLGYSYADRNIHLDDAEKLVNDAILLDQGNPAYLDSMAWVYFRQGKLDKAKDFMREAVAHIRDPLIWEHYGDIQLAGGENIDAVISWDESLRLDPKSKPVRAKIQKAMKNIPKSDRVGLYVKRAMANFGDIDSLNGLVKVTACVSKACFDSKASFAYAHGDELKVEVPGPLAGPIMVLTKVHGEPAKYGAIHPQFQTVGPYVTRAFDRIEQVISGELFKGVDIADLAHHATEKGRTLSASNNGFEVQFDNTSGAVKSASWTVDSVTDGLSFGSYGGEMSLTPSYFEWRGDSNVSIRVDFLNPAPFKKNP